SKFSALTTDSIESAMISRLGSEKRMPSVPIEIPSETVMVLKINGEAPASLIPRLDARARPSTCILQGVTALQVLATPIIGVSKSSSSKSSALKYARFGVQIGRAHV